MSVYDVMEHYKRLSKNYDEFYGNIGNEEAVLERIKDYLQCDENHQVVDLGAGTCKKAMDLSVMCGLKKKVICVDMCMEMLASQHSYTSVAPLCMDALSFSDLNIKYDRLFSNDALHHVPKEDFPLMFKNITKQLNPGGKIVIKKVVSHEDFPWFKMLKSTSTDVAADSTLLLNVLRNAGFSNVQIHQFTFPRYVEKDKICHMLEHRYVSSLSRMNDQDIAEGVEEVKEKYKDVDVIEFQYMAEYFVAMV